MKIYKYIITSSLLFASFICKAQMVDMTYHDEELNKIWTSIENGEWKFSPNFYFHLFHKNYSGATGGIFGKGYDVSKSNVGQLSPVRAEIETLLFRIHDRTKEEEARLKPLWEEDQLKQADRMVDLIYPMYQDIFNDMQNKISDALTLCIHYSKGRMQWQIQELIKDNDILCANIEYLHKSGPGNELSNSRRQQGYEDNKEAMNKLVGRAAILAALAKSLYDK